MRRRCLPARIAGFDQPAQRRRTTSQARFKDWLQGQNAYARAVIDRIPGRDVLQKRGASHSGAATVVTGVQLAGGRLFYGLRKPGDETAKLYVRRGFDGSERLLVDPDRAALYSVDATQHVREGAAYPAVLLASGYNDPRVAPWQPGKMAAHLQAAKDRKCSGAANFVRQFAKKVSLSIDELH